jgi:hypothetical protein
VFLLSKCALHMHSLASVVGANIGGTWVPLHLYNWYYRYCTQYPIGHGRAAPSNLSCDRRGGVLRLNEVWAPRTFVREGKASNLAGSTMVFHQGSTIRRVGVQDVRDLFLRSGCRRKIRAERSPTRFWM